MYYCAFVMHLMVITLTATAPFFVSRAIVPQSNRPRLLPLTLKTRANGSYCDRSLFGQVRVCTRLRCRRRRHLDIVEAHRMRKRCHPPLA